MSWLVHWLDVSAERSFERWHTLQFIETLLQCLPLVLQIVARPTGIRYRVVELNRPSRMLSSLHLPGVVTQTRSYQDGTQRHYPFWHGKLVYQLAAFDQAALISILDVQATHDPLLGFIHTLSYLRPNEEVRYSLFVTRPHTPFLFRGFRVVDDLLDVELAPQSAQKQAKTWYETLLLVDIESPAKQRVETLRGLLNAQLIGSFAPQLNVAQNGLQASPITHPRLIYDIDQFAHLNSLGWYAQQFTHQKIAQWWQKRWFYVSAVEIASLWHLPHKQYASANIYWHKAKPALPYPVARNRTGIELGQGHYQNQVQSVFMKAKDRFSHTNIIGRTGVGKTNFMHHLIHQDIQRGQGVAVIDPHGYLIRDILQHSIPPEREDDVIVLDLGQSDYPIPLNLLAGPKTYASIGRAVDIIEQFYPSTGVRMDRYLRAGIQALASLPTATMKDLQRLFTDDKFLRNVLENVEDEDVHLTLATEYLTLGASQKRTIRGPILNRISPFYANPYLYPHLCHPKCIDFEAIINQRKILLVSLNINPEIVPPMEQSLIGALLISLLQMHTMRPRSTITPFYAYIDEIEHFKTASLDVIFAQARKFGLILTVAHQYFTQLPKHILDALLGTVGATIVFQCDTPDAQRIEPLMKPQFSADDLVNLSKFEAAAKIQYDGSTQDAFLLKPMPPFQSYSGATKRELWLRGKSAERYTPQTRQQVMQWLNQNYASVANPTSGSNNPPADLDYDEFVD